MELYELNEQFRGGQAQAVIDGGRICALVDRIEIGQPNTVGEVVVHTRGPVWSWATSDPGNAWPVFLPEFSLSRVNFEGGLSGNWLFGPFLRLQRGRVTVLPPGHPSIWPTPTAEPITIEKLLRRYGELDVRAMQVGGQIRILIAGVFTPWSPPCVPNLLVVAGVIEGKSWHLVPPPSYEFPLSCDYNPTLLTVSSHDVDIFLRGKVREPGMTGFVDCGGDGPSMVAALQGFVKEASAIINKRR